MPHIANQKAFQQQQKPSFCYLCGQPLENGSELNDDHCPPQGLFLPADRTNYPIKLKVHRSCNHDRHAQDEEMSTLLSVIHGTFDVKKHLRRFALGSIDNSQGTYLGATGLPFGHFAYRIMQCAHALLYGEWLSRSAPIYLHFPVPSVDEAAGNIPEAPDPALPWLCALLCAAQKNNAYDSIVAYNKNFKFVSTWATTKAGESASVFAFDVYRLGNIGIDIDGFPRTVVGSYKRPKPASATALANHGVQCTREELLYPILI